MCDNYSSNITQIITSFESFIKLLEDPDWTRVAKIEDIKTAFKLGNFIEKATENFMTQNSLGPFFNILTKWLKGKNRTKVYSEKIFAVACDELIIKFFSCTNMSEVNLDIAVRVYTSIFPKKRFEEVLTRVLLNAGNLEALSDYIKSTFNDEHAKSLEYHLKLQDWDSLIQKGDINNVKEEVKNMLMPYNVASCLYLLLGILSLTQISMEEKVVQNLILDDVLEQMSQRNILTKDFWTTMIKSVNTKIICEVCKHFQDFLSSFLHFIVYTGSMMSKVGIYWKTDPNICCYPDIEYDAIFNILFELSKSSTGIKQSIIDGLNEAKKFTGTSIWEQILFELNERKNNC